MRKLIVEIEDELHLDFRKALLESGGKSQKEVITRLIKGFVDDVFKEVTDE